MRYTVNITRKAQKGLAKIPAKFKKKIISNIRQLAEEPFPSECKKLSGRDAWRLRIGTYRVIYEVHNDVLSVVVIVVGHRKDVYKR